MKNSEKIFKKELNPKQLLEKLKQSIEELKEIIENEEDSVHKEWLLNTVKEYDMDSIDRAIHLVDRLNK